MNGHGNIIKFCNRPWKKEDGTPDTKAHDKALIENWNNKVQDGDLVFHLGDFCTWKWQGAMQKYVEQLNGDIVLIKGNHDKYKMIKENEHLFRKVSDYEEFKIPGSKDVIVMSHYAMRVWNKSHFNSMHLYGHSHGKLPQWGKSWDIGVDNNNYEPLSLDEVLELMETLSDNFNKLKKKR